MTITREQCQPGVPVWYSPHYAMPNMPRYLGMVAGEPYLCGSTWVVQLERVEANYQNGRGYVKAAALDAIEPFFSKPHAELVVDDVHASTASTSKTSAWTDEQEKLMREMASMAVQPGDTPEVAISRVAYWIHKFAEPLLVERDAARGEVAELQGALELEAKVHENAVCVVFSLMAAVSEALGNPPRPAMALLDPEPLMKRIVALRAVRDAAAEYLESEVAYNTIHRASNLEEAQAIVTRWTEALAKLDAALAACPGKGGA